MDNITKLAIAKVFNEEKTKEIRKDVSPGDYKFDSILHLKGSMKVGDDYTQSIMQKLCPFKILIVALNHLNGATIESIVKETLDLSEDKETEEKLKKEVKKAIEKFGKAAASTCKGKVTLSLETFEDISNTINVETIKEQVPIMKG